MRRVSFFIIATVLLFGLLAWPGLAEKSKPTKQTVPSFEASSRFSAQLTFTPAVTIYLPLVLNPLSPPTAPTPEPSPTPTVSPPGLAITDLIFSGADEYVEIRNNGPGSQSMDGWQVVSVVGNQTYNFPNGVTLGVGQTLRIHTGPGAVNNPPGDLFWTTAFIWNNNGDKAELRDNQGIVRDTVCYGDGCP